MVSVFVAEQYRRIEAMRREQLADAARHGHQLTEVMERSVRLELAAALSITEYSAGALIAQADALVNRYPAVLDALGGARITQRHATELAAALDGVEPEFRDRLLGPGARAGRVAAGGHVPPQAARADRDGPGGDADGTARAGAGAAAGGAGARRGRHGVAAPVPARGGGARDLRPAHRAGESPRRATRTRPAPWTSSAPTCSATLLIDGVTDTLPPEARGIRATVVVTVPALALLDPDGDGDRRGRRRWRASARSR